MERREQAVVDNVVHRQEQKSNPGIKISPTSSDEVVKYKLRPGSKGYAVIHFIGLEMEVSASEAKGQFVVSENSCQPFGVLHGGVTALVAESIASAAAGIAAKKRIAGIELNVTHLRAIPLGSKVIVTAKALRKGERVQVWNVEFNAEKVESRNESNVASSGQFLAAVARVSLIVGLPDAENFKDDRLVAWSRI